MELLWNLNKELLQGVGGETVVEAMHPLDTKIQQEEDTPEDLVKLTIIPIYKRDGDPRDCKHFRGITLQGKSSLN